MQTTYVAHTDFGTERIQLQINQTYMLGTIVFHTLNTSVCRLIISSMAPKTLAIGRSLDPFA